MALLGDIRKKSWLLIIVIGVPLLAFLVGDIFSNGSIFGNPNKMGSADGVPITAQEYNVAYNRLSQNPQLQNASENIISQLAWDNLVSERVVAKNANKLGLVYTDRQYFEAAAMFFRSIQPNLIDANGVANINETKLFLAELKKATQAGNPQAQAILQQWENANPEAAMLRADFTNLVSSGILVTNTDANFAYQANTNRADINYTFVDYNTFNKKNNIEVTDDQIIDYLKLHKKEFKPQASVNIAYAYFPAIASNEDTNEVLNELNARLSPEYVKSGNNITDTIQSFANAKNDSIYVARFSEDTFDPTYYTKEQLANLPDANIRNLLANPEKGKVYGPVKTNDSYELIKVSGVKAITDSAKTSHILISYAGAQGGNATRTPQQAQQLADSILNVVKANPAKFNEIASTLSDDKVAAQDNGSIGWVGRFQQGFDPNYREFAMNNPKGFIGETVSQFGFHIIRIDDTKTKTGYQFAVIRKSLKASEATQENLFNKANKLAVDTQNKSTNEFINAARKLGAEVNNADGVTRFESDITGLSGTQKEGDILAWAFNDETKTGSIEKFETSTGGQILVYLSNKYSKKDYNVASYRGQLEDILKADLAQKKAKELIGNNKDLSAVSKILGGKTGTASNITFNQANIEGIGVEPNVGAVALALPKNATSNVIKGINGLFVIQVKDKITGAKKEDLSNEINSLQAQYGNIIQNSLIRTMVDAVDVEDNRAKVLIR
ncbi:peptidylprolyl isomerase [Weeksellaceae bacterium TAE3-ERU29]|nr:peptidylprolyl isomerase [Weeksellaceae bacterium TAE3-ERU29]